MAFPVNPTNGQLYNDGTYTYKYNSFLRTWTKVAQTTSNIGNVVIQDGTVSTSTMEVSNVSVGNITSNIVTVGDTSITSNIISVGETIVSSSNISIGETIVSSSNISIGETVLSSSNISVGETVLSSSNISVGQTVVSSSNVTVGNAIVGTDFISAPSFSGNLTTGTTSIVPEQDGNVSISVAGINNVVVITTEGTSFSGNTNTDNLTASNINVSGTLITGNIIPLENVTYDIGSSEKRFRDIWLSSNTIHLGDSLLSANGSQFIVSQNGNQIKIDPENLTVWLGDVPLSAGEQGLNVSSISSNQINTNNLNVSTQADISGNLTLSGSLVSGNILPQTDAVSSIGEQSKRYKNVYLSSNVTANVLITGPIATTYNVFSTTVNSTIIIDNFASSEFTTVKYIIQAKSIDGYHSTELFCMHDGLTAYVTEYATLISVRSLGLYTLTTVSGNCNLEFTPFNPENNIITIKLVRTAITA